VSVDLSRAQWRKSSVADSAADESVEVAFLDDGTVAVRNSQQPDGRVLLIPQSRWDEFVTRAKGGEFDA